MVFMSGTFKNLSNLRCNLQQPVRYESENWFDSLRDSYEIFRGNIITLISCLLLIHNGHLWESRSWKFYVSTSQLRWIFSKATWYFRDNFFITAELCNSAETWQIKFTLIVCESLSWMITDLLCEILFI